MRFICINYVFSISKSELVYLKYFILWNIKTKIKTYGKTEKTTPAWLITAPCPKRCGGEQSLPCRIGIYLIIRKTTNIFAKAAEWNLNGNLGRGELRVSYGSEYNVSTSSAGPYRTDRQPACGVKRAESEPDYGRSSDGLPCGQAACPAGSRK